MITGAMDGEAAFWCGGWGRRSASSARPGELADARGDVYLTGNDLVGRHDRQCRASVNPAGTRRPTVEPRVGGRRVFSDDTGVPAERLRREIDFFLRCARIFHVWSTGAKDQSEGASPHWRHRCLFLQHGANPLHLAGIRLTCHPRTARHNQTEAGARQGFQKILVGENPLGDLIS